MESYTESAGVANTQNCPRALEVNFDGIPQALKARAEWVLWRYTEKKGRWSKTPHQSNGQAASSTDPTTWSSIEVVTAAYRRGRFDGIGIVLKGMLDADGLTLAAVDLDHVTETPERRTRAKRIVASIGSYAEWSPSRAGLHIFTRARPLENGVVSRDGVELYTSRRYITVTGHLFEGDL